VLNQEEHHRTRSFEEEFISLLKNCGIQYDLKYVFGYAPFLTPLCGWGLPVSLPRSEERG
jgi:hypothetical protein